ncbi:MAG: hypothetical protein LAO04_17920 [Acidobacteriia bacterium]|nr:hypothetical protein [Terriglobia bacterium]
METLKRAEDVQQPDARSDSYVRLDTGRPVTFQDRYSAIATVRLNPGAPEDVRSYFATIQNLCVYAWFAYDFYALVVFLSYTLIEMALRLRFAITGKDTRTLQNLLEEAIKRNSIQEKAFSHMRRIRQQRALSLRLERQIRKMPRSSVPKSDYPKVLLQTLPKLRNAFAHPRMHAIYLPGDALFALRFAADFVNQLFSPPNSDERDQRRTPC